MRNHRLFFIVRRGNVIHNRTFNLSNMQISKQILLPLIFNLLENTPLKPQYRKLNVPL